MEMNDRALKEFEFHGASLRSVMIKGEPWFVAADVTEILGLGNPRAAVARHVDDEDRDGVTFRDAIGREQKTTVVNESGLYSLIFGSTKPEAKRFKHWVTKEVLPEIRRTGRYSKEVSPWLSTHPSQWHKTFRDAYFLQIFRLKGKRPPKRWQPQRLFEPTSRGHTREPGPAIHTAPTVSTSVAMPVRSTSRIQRYRAWAELNIFAALNHFWSHSGNER
jgi:prophage antirepressor-like protein